MARLPRFYPPNSTYEIVIRTQEGRRLLRPVPELRRGVLDVIGRALALFPVSLHAFTFLSNHGHLLLTSATGEILAAFVCHVSRNTAIVIRKVTGWQKRVWMRAIATPVLDDAAAVSRLRYVVANGVKEGLVEHPLLWPGPTSTHALLTGDPIETRWEIGTDHARKTDANVRVERHEIRLTPLPSWSHRSLAERCAAVGMIVDDIVAAARIERAGRPFLGVKAVLALDPFEPVPLENETPPPLAHASTLGALNRFRAERRVFHDAYLRASARLRSRDESPPTFPLHGFPPAPPFEAPD
jgi:REP element-mobilizing transposase RayT